jgi:hypothetical protein
MTAMQLKGLRGLDTVLRQIRVRADAAEKDTTSRIRFLEPDVFSQTEKVPYDTVEKVIRHLHQLGVVHLWARVLCPNDLDIADNTVFETDDPSEFERQLELSCRHCGQFHSELSWEFVEMFYGFNMDTSQIEEIDPSVFFPNPRLTHS